MEIPVSGFLAALPRQESFADGVPFGLRLPTRPTGSLPVPFDALNGGALAGPEGSHPLALVRLADLVRPATPGLEGTIELAGPARIGEAISGTLRVRARKRIEARGAALRLVGVRIAEQAGSGEARDDGAIGVGGFGTVTPGRPVRVAGAAEPDRPRETVRWVEVHGREIEALAFPDVPLPATLEAGQSVEVPFTIPAPRLGPPTAHAGVAAIAWAVEARWEVAMGADERVAVPVEIRQHPDLLRAGVVRLPAGALFDGVDAEGATLAIRPVPPLAPGAPFTFAVTWPGAPDGRSARVELLVDVRGAANETLTLATLEIDRAALAGTEIALTLPTDAPPTMETDGLSVGWRVRAIVDRKLRSDEHRERAFVVA